MTKLKSTLIWTALVLGASQAHAVAVTDTIQAPTGFFTPSDAQKLDSPYYRGKGADWSWTHNAIAGAITNAHLNISAYDVDAPSEVDKIYAMDDGVWTLLGSLDGNNNTWAFTDFVLGSNFDNDINAGLQVKIEIDTATNGSWLVSLAKSSLTVDGGRLPPPVPGIPEPETYALMLAGLAAVGTIVKRRKSR
jgi:hypothetical protein